MHREKKKTEIVGVKRRKNIARGNCNNKKTLESRRGENKLQKIVTSIK